MWLEKYVLDYKWVIYFGTLGISNFKIGFTLGHVNTIYLGFICFGLDKN